MKLLLDACVWPGAAVELARHGHDVVWVGNWPTAPEDDEILAFAVKHGEELTKGQSSPRSAEDCVCGRRKPM